MIVLSYNCRGLGNPRTVRALRGIVEEKDPDVVFLSETKMKAGEMERVRQRLRLGNKVYVDCSGHGRHRSGGLAFFWKSHLELNLKSKPLNHINLQNLGRDGEEIWRLTGIYGYPKDEDKMKTWDLLRALHGESCPILPWLCFGDINEILVVHENKGGNDKSQALITGFQNAVSLCDFRDMGFQGHEFTWSNNQGGVKNVQERLDRFLANSAWFTIFPWHQVLHLPKRRSNHLPILLECRSTIPPQLPQQKKKKKRPYRFEKAWLQKDDCEKVVADLWSQNKEGMGSEKILTTCKMLRKKLGVSAGLLQQQIKNKKEEIERLHGYFPTEGTIERIKTLNAEIDELEKQEETMWFQQSRQSWITDGDRNTSFFHQKATFQEMRDTIQCIEDENGQVQQEDDIIEQIFLSYFQALFSSSGPDGFDQLLDTMNPTITMEMNSHLTKPYTGL